MHFIQSIGYSACFRVDPLSWVMPLLWVSRRMHCPLSHCVPPRQFNASKSSVVSLNVQREFMLRFYTCSQNKFFVSVNFDSILWLHYTQNSRTLFRVSCHRCGIHHGPPLTRLFLSTSAHHPGISLRNKLVPWDLYALMIDSLTLDIGSHHWPLIERFDWVFDIKSSIHTQEIVLGYIGNHWHQWWSHLHLLMVLIIDR